MLECDRCGIEVKTAGLCDDCGGGVELHRNDRGWAVRVHSSRPKGKRLSGELVQAILESVRAGNLTRIETALEFGIATTSVDRYRAQVKKEREARP